MVGSSQSIGWYLDRYAAIVIGHTLHVCARLGRRASSGHSSGSRREKGGEDNSQHSPPGAGVVGQPITSRGLLSMQDWRRETMNEIRVHSRPSEPGYYYPYEEDQKRGDLARLAG